MNFAQQQRNPTKHIAGMAFVVLLHIGIIYALINGLARKVVEVIQQPLETKIIEEVKAPPPPEIVPPPPPKMMAPPPPFIPPPEVQIQQPPPVQNVITAVTATPPPADAPAPVAAPPVVAPPAAAAAPAPNVRAVCPNVATVVEELTGKFERLARKEGIDQTVEVQIEFVVDPTGKVKDARVVKSTNQRVNSIAMSGISQLGCKGQGQDVKLIAPFEFKMR